MSQEPTNPNDDSLEDIFLEPDEPEDEVIALGASGAEPATRVDLGSGEGAADSATGSADRDAQSGDRLAQLESTLEQLQEELDATKDRLLRKAADLENARRRHQREKDELTKYASESVIKDILPVLDDLERALAHLDQSGAEGTLLDGVSMVATKFRQVLERRGIVAVVAAGAPFDPQFHEAIQQVEDTTVPHNTVVQEFQRGYLIHDRLLRPALVVVAQGGPPAESAELEASEESGDSADDSGEPGGGSSSSTEPS